MPLEQTKTIYDLPVPSGSVTLTVMKNPSHIGPYTGSIDLAVPVGTVVCAAADGVVSRVRDDSNSYGNDPKFGQDVNYITINDPGEEIAEYLHLDKGSAKVQVGDQVNRGQPIAQTGLSGWMTAPHLHWMVYRTNPFRCLEIKLEQPLPKLPQR